MPMSSTFRAMHGEETQKDILNEITSCLQTASSTYISKGSKLTPEQCRRVRALAKNVYLTMSYDKKIK